VYRRFTEEWPESVNYFTPTGDERWKLDLWGLNRLALQEMGVLDENVQISELCTICRPDLFFSHRASGGVTGRLAGAIGFTKAGE
jgi:copper oxidase (laccase) domain-containing protein